MRVLKSCTDTVEVLCLDEAKIERHINQNYILLLKKDPETLN